MMIHAEDQPIPDTPIPWNSSPGSSLSRCAEQDNAMLTRVIGKLLYASSAKLKEIDETLGDARGPYTVTVPAVLRLLGISRATLYRRIKKGELAPLPVDGKETLFVTQDITDYLRSQSRGREAVHEQ